MSQEQLSLASTGLLSAAITSGATSLTLSQAPGFPTSPQFRLWWPETGEMMIVTAVASLTYTVTRGADGTTASAHNANEACYHWPTPGGIGNYVGGPNPMTALGDMLYGDTSGVPSGQTGAWLKRLAGDTSNVRKFLRTLSIAGVAQAPAWDTLQAGDLPARLHSNTQTAATATTTSTTYVDLDSATVTTNGGDLLILWTGDAYFNGSAADQAGVRLVLDGTAVGNDPATTFTNSTSAFLVVQASFMYIATGVAAGSHTIKTQWKRIAGTDTVEAQNRSLLIVELF